MNKQTMNCNDIYGFIEYNKSNKNQEERKHEVYI